jgi:hypothetical protein
VGFDIAKDAMSFACSIPLEIASPGVGIFLFFLLFVFSKESYPSADDVVDAGGSGLGYLAVSGF